MNRATSDEQRTTSPAPCPIKVVYVIDDLGLGGAQRQLTELVRAIDRSRYQPYVVSLSTQRLAYAKNIRELEIPLTLIEHEGIWSWRTLWQILRLLQRVRPTVVHTWLFTADLYGRLAAWLTRVPVIVSAVRSVDPWKPRHYIFADRLLCNVTSAFTVNAQAIGEVLRKREGVEPSKLHTIYNGVDLSAFDPSIQDGALRRHLGLDRVVRLVGIVGRLAPEKDHQTFLHSARLVVERHPDVRFLIVGNGPLRSELDAMIRKLKLQAHVHMLESQQPITPIFAALDMVVVSSRYEGCCNVILEAMAMGKPVIATDVGGNPELVSHEETGFLIPPGEPQAMAEAIERLLQQRSRAQYFGQQARRIVESRFNLKRMIDQTMALYDALLCRVGPLTR